MVFPFLPLSIYHICHCGQWFIFHSHYQPLTSIDNAKSFSATAYLIYNKEFIYAIHMYNEKCRFARSMYNICEKRKLEKVE